MVQYGHESPEEYREQLQLFLDNLFAAESWKDRDDMTKFLRKLQDEILEYEVNHECYLKRDMQQQSKCLTAEKLDTFISDALEQS